MNKSTGNTRDSGGMTIWLKTVAGIVVFGLLLIAMIVGTGVLNPEEDSGTVEQLADLPPDERAKIAWERGRWQTAETAYREMIEADQFDGRSLFFLALCIHRQNRLDEALVMYERASDFVEWAAWCYYNLACINALQDRPDDAIEALDKAVDRGLNLRIRIEDDKDLVSLHDDPRFLQISLKQFVKSGTDRRGNAR
ncbi:MAG: tetratricopeptide repeat protein [Pirellulaceae bacterium]